jgi:hypothetical protein
MLEPINEEDEEMTNEELPTNVKQGIHLAGVF